MRESTERYGRQIRAYAIMTQSRISLVTLDDRAPVSVGALGQNAKS